MASTSLTRCCFPLRIFSQRRVRSVQLRWNRVAWQPLTSLLLLLRHSEAVAKTSLRWKERRRALRARLPHHCVAPWSAHYSPLFLFPFIQILGLVHFFVRPRQRSGGLRGRSMGVVDLLIWAENDIMGGWGLKELPKAKSENRDNHSSAIVSVVCLFVGGVLLLF